MGNWFQSANWPDALKIRTKDGRLKPFVPTEFQKLFVKVFRAQGDVKAAPMDVNPKED